MDIDNTMMLYHNICPMKYYERFEVNDGVGIVPDVEREALDVGQRTHLLFERHYGGQPEIRKFPEAIENETDVIMAAYKAYYPTEDFTVVATEQPFRFPLLSKRCPFCQNISFSEEAAKMLYCEKCEVWFPVHRHDYLGKMDMIVRYIQTKKLALLETKTEKRSGKGNLPGSWEARTQASLYFGVAQAIYGEDFQHIILNLIRRPSPAGRIPPEFSRQILYRTPELVQEAFDNIIYVADRIESHRDSGFWPVDKNQCQVGDWKCDYYPLHIVGRTDETLRKFKPAEKYLPGL
jgi:hypothetical protein